MPIGEDLGLGKIRCPCERLNFAKAGSTPLFTQSLTGCVAPPGAEWKHEDESVRDRG